jgi:acetate kinase
MAASKDAARMDSFASAIGASSTNARSVTKNDIVNPTPGGAPRSAGVVLWWRVMQGAPLVLTINTGSSSVKVALYAAGDVETLVAAAAADRIDPRDGHGAALRSALASLTAGPGPRKPAIVAHRLVHGGEFTEPQRITPPVLAAVRRLVGVDPDHLPQAIAAVDTVARLFPDVPQIACFDTAFHGSMPPVARLYPLPSRFSETGVRRYGFHGLSCEYILFALRAIDASAAEGRLIVAHLGGGCSMTAVHHGRSIDTTMGFSPAGGLMMGTRPGDLDPGVLLYALRELRMSQEDLNRLINRESGLAGVSGTSSDMRDLLAREATDPRAASAVELFCYLARKSVGALAAALGCLDTLVFTGGIGEHSAAIRERVAGGLEGLGVAIDPARNASGAAVISSDASRVTVRVMATNEDLILARHARRFLS